MAVCPKWTIFALVMKTRQELTEVLDFIAEYATYLLGSGVHTSRVIRNSQRIGASQGVDLQLSSFQKSTIITAHDEESGEAITRVVKIPALPVSFERNSDLSALSWDALDEGLPLSEIRKRYDELTAKPRIDPIFVLLTVGLANASFCRLFGGDWIAMGIVFTSTLVGFAAKQRMQAHGVNHFLIFIISAFMASLCASAALRFDCSAETALATSVLFLVPGVPLINGVIDIVEGHILIGCSRLINALLLIICIAIFAAIAAIGFGAVSDPPMRAFPRIALLAAMGHALRFCLMHYFSVDIATASLFASISIGFGSLWLGRGIRCPMTALYIPALLPMVPGIYAYKTVFSLIMFLQSLNDPGEGLQYMQQFFLNATVSLSVIALLAAGATLPIFVFNHQAFSLTRRRKHTDK